jgi:hypothetical protein
MKRLDIFWPEIATKGDSHEVMRAHYVAQLVRLEKELNRLTILEHPRQVQDTCRRIIKVKNLLSGFNKKL